MASLASVSSESVSNVSICVFGLPRSGKTSVIVRLMTYLNDDMRDMWQMDSAEALESAVSVGMI